MKNDSFAWVKLVHDNNAPLFFIMGPCVIESVDRTLRIAEHVKLLSEKFNCRVIFKSSFDKANRTALSGSRGIGVQEGLEVLARVKKEFDLPIITDVHESSQVTMVSAVADVIQVPAFLCRQTDLLLAAGKSGKPVHVKKGQFVSSETMAHVIKKIESTGNSLVWLCERGYAFGYNNLIIDYRNFPIMKSFGKPVIFDVTHSVQRPSLLGNATSGDRCFISPLAAAAMVQSIAGIFMEIHDEPEVALSDGPNSVRLSQLEGFMSYLIQLDAWAKEHKYPELT